MTTSRDRKWGWIVLAFLLFYTFRAARYINLSTADLGRHLTNGKWVFQDSKVLFTNFYSYTFPDYSFVNHHWGSGVIFHLFEQLFGFEGLSILFLILEFAAFFLVFRESKQKYGPLNSIVGSLFAFPLFTFRTEVRPEAFSLLFSAAFFWVLSTWQRNKSNRTLYFMPLLMVLWVNTHVCFIFGFLILGSFFLEHLWNFRVSRIQSSPESQDAERELGKAKCLLKCIFFCSIATLINPIGIKLSLAPFQSFTDYGYRILENQSIYFILNLGWYLMTFPYLAVAAATLIGITLNRSKPPLSLVIISFSFLILSTLAIRNYPFLGLFSIPLIAFLFSKSASRLPLGISLAFNLGYLTLVHLGSSESIGLGLMTQMDASIRFFKENRLTGPIFNNYDIGGFLIYYLFPDERVFVDNRPEAYPSTFFTQTYVPMQENELIWKSVDEKLHFNVIFFAWHDFTPAAQTFLHRRVSDPNWVPVFVDPYALIFVKNNESNKLVIARYEIPRTAFK